MIEKGDLAFLAAQAHSEHFRVIDRLIVHLKEQLQVEIAGAQNTDSLLRSQGALRAFNAFQNTLKNGILVGEETVKEAEKEAVRKEAREKLKPAHLKK